MNLDSKLRVNPWPEKTGPGEVLFILDARNHFEEDILRQWVAQHARQDGREYRQICLSLADDRDGVDSAPLVSDLATAAETTVAPLRITWLPSDAAREAFGACSGALARFQPRFEANAEPLARSHRFLADLSNDELAP